VVVLCGVEFQFHHRVDVPIQPVVSLVKFERSCVVMLAGGGIFVGCCGVIGSPPAWFVLKIKNTHGAGLLLGKHTDTAGLVATRPRNGEYRPTR